MKLTKKDYQNALEIWSSYCWKTDNELTFPGYIEVKLAELEDQKLKTPMYKCIKLPHANGMFEIGNLYTENYCIVGFTLSELPFHFVLVEPEPEPEPEKITWQEVISLINNAVISNHLPPDSIFSDLIKIINRIKTDHL